MPRAEYPRPQFVRPDWLCLNGAWQFEIDAGDSGLERGLRERPLTGTIQVPFCPESPLSGIDNQDFLNAVWYRRTVDVPAAWAGRRILLHFQAVDYDATVWVNGEEVGRHRGGFSPFTCDLGDIANTQAGETLTIVVRARDDHRPPQPRGKQAQTFGPRGAIYLRTTGIWQSVWLEPVSHTALERPRITPDLAAGAFHIVQPLVGAQPGQRLRVRLFAAQSSLHAAPDAEARTEIAQAETPVADFAPQLTLAIPADQVQHWSPGAPFLYDLEFTLLDAAGQTLDQATSYAGLRSITFDGKKILINGTPIFQRLVLDQGYYADGIMTAPSDAALIEDIELSLAAGFNGARLHQKVFEERFLYHADRLGYLVWGEFGDWGCRGQGPRHDHQQPGATYITQWLEVLARDYNHPSIVGWCPLNETWQPLSDRITNLDDVTRGMFLATKAMDSTRPVLDVSGYSHRVTESDVYDSHDYAQDPATFRANHAQTGAGVPHYNGPRVGPNNEYADEQWSVPYRGQPYFVSEFGGIWWNPAAKPGDDSWGYGARPTSIEEFYTRFEQLCAILLEDPAMFGYCYTQLTDVYQEQNGIYGFDRSRKFDMARIRAAQMRAAAIETDTAESDTAESGTADADSETGTR
ncbi:MAG: sugar-binding domain-containing protein [Litorilinea sp.]